MLAETLLLYSCTTGHGCPEATELYYKYNPLFKETLNTRIRVVEEQLPKIMWVYGMPLAAALSGRYDQRITNRISLHVRRELTIINYGWRF